MRVLLELGLEPVKAKSCRRPKLPSLCLKYDADARILSLATHWVDLPFEQLQSLVIGEKKPTYAL
jgi:hypothetical protein